MNAIWFFSLMLLSIAGAVLSFVFLQGPLFYASLAASLAFPAISFAKGVSVLIKRRMIASFIAEELYSASRDTADDLVWRHHRARRQLGGKVD